MEICEIAENPPKPIAKRLWHILRAVKHFTNLNLRLLSCQLVDPAESFYTPLDVEFSCSNTPIFFPTSKKRRRHRHNNAKAVARAFEILSTKDHGGIDSSPRGATPSPVHQIRQLRVTDSPFPLKEEEGEVGRHVDEEAEDFIRRFYQQLRYQHQLEPMVGQARA